MADDDSAPSADSVSSDDPGSNGKKPRGWRRLLILLIVILTAFVVYAFAFAKTDVSLDEIQSETRQEQLFRILRALARPDLITYDKEDLVLTQDVFVPCNGTEPAPSTPASTGANITITPTCAEPGDTMTVNGTQFEPGKLVTVNFVPRSDFVVVLPQGRSEVAEDGTFTLTFEVPERTSDETQQVQAITKTNVGSWMAREEVWTDSNNNGVQDSGSLPDSDENMAVYDLLLPEFEIRDPGGVTIVDENNNVLDFISWGGEFEAATGSATGLLSSDTGLDPFAVGEGESDQLAGSGVTATDFQWVGPAQDSFGDTNAGQTATDVPDDLFFNELAFGEAPTIELAGAPGTSVEDVSLIFFDGTDGNQYKIIPVADETNLSPRLSDNALNTWDRIIETVMLALLATTVGTALAVPLSFMAAKNLMKDVTVPVINLSLSLLAIPVGLIAGIQAARWARGLRDITDANFVTLALTLAVLAGAAWLLLRFAFPAVEEDRPPLGVRTLRLGALLVVGFLAMIGTYVLSDMLILFGGFVVDVAPFGRFMGSFIVSLGEIVEIGVPVFASLIGAGALATAASKVGYWYASRVSLPVLNISTLVTSGLAGGLVGMTIGAIIDWFYQFE
ncbi:MAG: hypothetical protein ACR2NG_04135, partial [Acidimicrobiia bacterium]